MVVRDVRRLILFGERLLLASGSSEMKWITADSFARRDGVLINEPIRLLRKKGTTEVMLGRMSAANWMALRVMLVVA